MTVLGFSRLIIMPFVFHWQSLVGAHGRSMGVKDGFLVSFDDKQYDIQRFLSNHPGGVNTLENYKNKTVVTAMQKFGHSSSAYHLLRDFLVQDDSLQENQFLCRLSDNGRIKVDGDNGRNVEELKLLEDLESRLDWSKPMLSQIDKVADHYQLWVHSAVYKRCILFENRLLERMTFTPWYFAPMFWIPIIIYMTWLQALKYVFGHCEGSCPKQIPVYQFAILICSGVLIWTIIEYCLHRWVFHLRPGKSLLWMKLHFLLHGVHHKVPFDSCRLVFPPLPAALLAFIIYTPISCVLPYPEVILIGGISGFLIYDMIHYYIHHGSPKAGSYLYAMKRYHSSHHFVNHNIGFGISSKFWDIVFQSRAHIKKLNISLRWK